jgi:hypothetical protein
MTQAIPFPLSNQTGFCFGLTIGKSKRWLIFRVPCDGPEQRFCTANPPSQSYPPKSLAAAIAEGLHNPARVTQNWSSQLESRTQEWLQRRGEKMEACTHKQHAAKQTRVEKNPKALLTLRAAPASRYQSKSHGPSPSAPIAKRGRSDSLRNGRCHIA